MAGNSQRRGAVRKAGTKKGTQVGSGGVRRRGLEARGATPPAHQRPKHPAAAKAAKRAAKNQQQRRQQKRTDDTEVVLGRNPVLECLRAGVPATALYVAQGIDIDDRITEIIRTGGDRGIPLLEVGRAELDRMTGGVLHQGVGLQVPPFAYEAFDDLMAAALEHPTPLLVALDGITDPRNLGAVIRSAAAFGAQGVFVPERRAAHQAEST